jgi:hypothetical protein
LDDVAQGHEQPFVEAPGGDALFEGFAFVQTEQQAAVNPAAGGAAD